MGWKEHGPVELPGDVVLLRSGDGSASTAERCRAGGGGDQARERETSC